MRTPPDRDKLDDVHDVEVVDEEIDDVHEENVDWNLNHMLVDGVSHHPVGHVSEFLPNIWLIEMPLLIKKSPGDTVVLLVQKEHRSLEVCTAW